MNKNNWMVALTCATLALMMVPASSAEMDLNNPLGEILDRTINDDCNGTLDPVCWECDDATGECKRCVLYLDPIDRAWCGAYSPLLAAMA